MDGHAHLSSTYQHPLPTPVNHAFLAQQQQLLLQSEHPRPGPSQHTPNATYAPSAASLQVHRNSMGENTFTPQHPNVFPRRSAVDYGAFFPSSGLSGADVPDKYIPSSTDRVTSSDHRPLDDIFASLQPLLGAGPGPSMQYDQSHTHFYPPRNQSQYSQHLTPHTVSSRQYDHPPQSHHHVSQQILRRPLIRSPVNGVLPIPLMQVDNQQRGSDLVINFRCWERGLLTDGVSVSELLHRQAYALERGLDRVLDGLRRADMKLNIIWPGYPPFVRTISPVLSDGRAITRAELGYQVALAFSDFFCEAGKTQPNYAGPFTIISVRNGNLSTGICFDRLRLLSVQETSLGEWTPEVSAVTWVDNGAP